MGVQTFTMADIISPVAPARLFKAFAIDNHNLLPKVVPHFIQSIENIEGDPASVGGIQQINFPQGSPIKFVRNRVDEIDCENLYLKYTSIDGNFHRETLECAVYEDKYEAYGSGCRATMVAHYHTKGDYVMKEEDINVAKELIKMLFKAVEDYLIANPTIYA